MRLDNFTTAELVEKILQLDDRYQSLRKVMKNIKNQDARATLKIQLDVYKLTKVLILQEISKRKETES
ncbi:MAG: hypothetical protein K0S53_419 [Bacteroidetes bacterium]|jgi:hypothetical protein|nr:hypothetical protein [Bacteroidota bacterium]MDF2451864.1 hypothetical protein [Bacteroidota bacterium]